MIRKITIILLGLALTAEVLSTNAMAAAFVDNGNGTVTDLSTGLMWQQDTSGTMDWATALSYCEEITLAGYTDWRLPTLKEIHSLVDYHTYNLAIDESFFPEIATPYWSSTADVLIYNWAWIVDFYDGYYHSTIRDNFYVRAVRGGQSGAFGEWTIGTSAGMQQPSVPASQPLELNVNSTNPRGDAPAYQWLIYTMIINGAQSPLYVISDRGTVELTDSVLTYLSDYTFTFDIDNITPISTLSMSHMGLKSGDYFLYAYAYMNAAGILYIDNVVTVAVN